MPLFSFVSNKTPEQPDTSTIAANNHGTHRCIPQFFKPVPSQSSWYLNHWLTQKMTHFHKKVDFF